MSRKFVVILTMLLCSVATQVFALGLGTVSVESALNQPLRVRIEILQLTDARLQDVVIQMASADDFERFNIDRVGFLSNIRFDIESTSRGNAVILSSDQIVREPYLSFILETRWPNGRLLSEHTILLDLPVFDDQQPAAPVRQAISPILQAPTSTQPTVQPFVDQASSTVSAPALSSSPASNAADLQPEQITSQAEPVLENVADVEKLPEDVAEEVEVVEETVADEATEEITEEMVDEPVLANAADASEPDLDLETTIEETVTAVEETAVEETIVEEIEEEVTLQAEEVANTEEADAVAIEAAAEPEPPETIETTDSDTLSDIALQLRPNNSVSMQQTMLAIQQLNPDAFADDNINRMLSGQVLRVPSLADVEAIDARDAVDEVARQNQAFAQVDVQALAAPADASPNQDDVPQGQLSVVNADDAIDASGGTAQQDAAEIDELDQRIFELENELLLRQEEADRARIEREELDARLLEMESQIIAAEEIIRLQDIQLAQLQQSFIDAAEQAQQQAELAAQQVQVEVPESLPASNSLLDDIMRNSLFMMLALILAVLLIVGLLLRRNRAAKLEDEELDEIAENFEDVTEVGPEEEKDELTKSEFDDFDEAKLDSELDDIISAGEGSDTSDLDVLERAQELISQHQYDSAASLLASSLQELGDSTDIRILLAEAYAKNEDRAQFETEADVLADSDTPGIAEKLSELRLLLDGGSDDQEFQQDELEAGELAETAEFESEEEKSNEFETQSFLDDLGIDLDTFDDDETLSEEKDEVSDAPVDSSVLSDEDYEAEEMGMTFDLGGDIEDISQTGAESESVESTKDAGIDGVDFNNPELEAGSESVEQPSDEETQQQEPLDIESFEFEAEELPASTTADSEGNEENSEEDLELETFSFDTQDSSLEEEAESAAVDQPAVSDEEELEEAEEEEYLEKFDFDLDEAAADTVIESPTESDSLDANKNPEPEPEQEQEQEQEFSGDELKVTADDVEGEDFDFDLDELDGDNAGSDVDDNSLDDSDLEGAFLDLDANDEDESTDDEIEFDFDEKLDVDLEPEDDKLIDMDDDDDLGFLSGDEEVEIESVDEIEEIEHFDDDDEVATKLELAYAYQKMGDIEGAKEILQEVIAEGSSKQVSEAKKSLSLLDAS